MLCRSLLTAETKQLSLNNLRVLALFLSYPERVNVWYRHTGEMAPSPDEIPEMNVYHNPKEMTLTEIRADIGDYDITHMWIEKKIPTWLYRVAPHLRVLKLANMPNLDIHMER